MREIKSGNEGSVNSVLKVYAMDEPGVGGACHEYQVRIPLGPQDETDGSPEDGIIVTRVKFQKGAIHESGINGSTNEALLAIVIDRLRGFAGGQFPSRETSIALTKCEEALHWMEARTRERAVRGVEGKHER